MKIVSIKKRNPFIRFFTINYWRVGVEDDNRKVKYYNCWADTKDPSVSTLLWDLRRKMSEEAYSQEIYKLVGRNI